MKDLCIVAQGGGVRSAYDVGVVKGLIEKFGITEVKNIVAISGGAANFIYYVAKQHEEMEKIWRNLIGSHKFVGVKNLFHKKPFLDVDFFLSLLMNKFPLNKKNFRNSRTEIFISVVGENKKIKYFSNKDGKNPYSLLKATCALPLIYGKYVKIGRKKYYDGGVLDNIGLKKIKQLKPKKILVILTTPGKFSFKERLISWIANKIIFRRDIEKGVEKDLLKIKNFSKEVFVIRPRISLSSSSIDGSTKHLRKTIKRGYKDTIKNKNLEKFLKSVKDIK